MKTFSKTWNSSVKPNKQRKFRFNAPLHIKGNFLNAHLSKELRAKYGTRSLRVRKGDKVKIMRGQFKKQEGKIEEVDIKKSIVYVAKIEHTKRDGTKARYPLQPSNLLILEVNADDKRRFSKKDKTQKSPSDNPEKTVVKPKTDVTPENSTKKSVKKSAEKLPVKSSKEKK